MVWRFTVIFAPALMLLACDDVRKPSIEDEDPAARAVELGRPVAPTETFTDLPPLKAPDAPPPSAAPTGQP